LFIVCRLLLVFGFTISLEGVVNTG